MTDSAFHVGMIVKFRVDDDEPFWYVERHLKTALGTIQRLVSYDPAPRWEVHWLCAGGETSVSTHSERSLVPASPLEALAKAAE